MVCEICKKKDAIFFIKEVVFGKERQLALCEDCAMKHKETIMPSNMQIEKLIKSLLDFTGEETKSTPEKAPKKHKNKRCPVCGSTYDEVILGSTIGCAKCYDTFRSDIDEIVDSISKDISYKGDNKKSTKTSKTKKTNDIDKDVLLRDYKKDLNDAIKNEDFEKAAMLRDEIKKLEGKKVTKKTETKKVTTKKQTSTKSKNATKETKTKKVAGKKNGNSK